MSHFRFPENFESGADALLFNELADVDDDDDVRVCMIVAQTIEYVEQTGQVPVPGIEADEALILLRGMLDRRVTAGEMRRRIAHAKGKIARQTT